MISLSTSAFYERSSMQIGGLRRQAERLQSQVGSGERLVRSSDDPVAAARVRELSRQSRFSDVDKANSDRANTDLKLADEAVSSIAGIVIKARELALRGANSSLADSARTMIAREVEALSGSLLSLANARDSAGQALFGGETPGAAYEEIAGAVAYVGTGTAPETDLGDGQSVTRSITGPELLDFPHDGAVTNLFVVLGSLATGLAASGAVAVTAATEALGALDSGLEKVTTAQTVIGTRLNFVESAADRRVAGEELLAEEQSTLGGADLAETITRLQETMTVLEASQASFVRLSGLSLFDMLR